MARLCILIGGSKGLGAALLQRYRAEGYRLEGFSRSGQGDGHHDLDLSRREEAIDTVDQQLAFLSKQVWQEVQLILNAGSLSPIGPLHMSAPKQWWQHMDTNFTLPISILGCFQRHFQVVDCRKVVAFVSSGAANKPFHGWSLYCASKAGVEQCINTMALEQQSQACPILCANLDPGVMDTQMQAQIRQSSTEQFADLQRFTERYQDGGLVAPAVVADNIFEALSGSFENGERIRVSG